MKATKLQTGGMESLEPTSHPVVHYILAQRGGHARCAHNHHLIVPSRPTMRNVAPIGGYRRSWSQLHHER